ncbi:ABC transporter AbcH.1 [Borealophlyctis nickersoniae]|nr:ABC transporter AbcH.1 [Borealophlyctis nickersoniae]
MIGTIDKPTKGEMTVCDTGEQCLEYCGREYAPRLMCGLRVLLRKVITPNTKDEVLASLRLSKLGFVFQSFNLLSSMTALENVELPMVLKGVLRPADRRAVAVASLERVGLGHRLHHFPAKLSGGEQQRVTIARAIANSPELLLLDEPTGDLDTNNTHRVIDLLYRLNTEENMTMIMVTHDVYLKNFAHRVVYMRDGKVHRVEMVASGRRRQAVRELYEAMGSRPPTASTNRTTNSSANAALGAAGPSSSQTTQTFDGAAQHRPGLWVSASTEVRNPGDYATYSSKSGKSRQLESGFDAEAN